MAKNLCGKTRKVNSPYEIWVAGGWEWRVLKKYKSPENEAKDPYARWLVAVASPMTGNGYEMGDSYASEIKNRAYQMPDEDVAKHLVENQWKEH